MDLIEGLIRKILLVIVLFLRWLWKNKIKTILALVFLTLWRWC